MHRSSPRVGRPCVLLLRRVALGLLALSSPVLALQVGEVTITGVDGDVRDNVRATVSIANQPADRSITEARLEYLLQQVPLEVRRALEPFGYYDAETEVVPRREGDRVQVRVRVRPGQPVRVVRQHVMISGPGAQDPILQRLRAEFEPAPGQVLLHEQYEASKRNIQRGLLARGFFDAEQTRARVEVTRAEHRADILLDWDSGPRARYGELRIEGSQVDPELLRNRAREQIVEGEPFDQGELLLMHQRLVELDYFSVVEVQPLAGEASGDPPEVPIEVRVEPAKQSIYKAGVSYGTDHGAGLQLGFERRWLNRRGHKWASELELSQRRSIIAGQYRIPAFERLPGWWALGARAEQLRSGAIDSDVVGLLVSRSTEWRGDRWTARMHVDRERYDDRDSMEQRYTTLVYPALRFERKHLDEPLYPRSGYGVSAEVRAGSTAIGSDVDFAQLWLRGAVIFGIGEWQRIITRAELGRTWGDDLQQLPPSLRFFAGGDRSVRGYGYQELGPRNDRGDTIGGRNLLTAGVEYERMFTPTWGGAVFVDAGNAFNGRNLDAAVGVGIGLRWRSPIGPVRVDIGHGLDEPNSTVRLHLTIGPQL